MKDYHYFQKIENAIASHLNLTELKTGIQIIRNEKGWRENEIAIEYIWIVEMSLSFVGWGSIFQIKFKENKFRQYSNEDKLVQGILLFNNDGPHEIYFTEDLNTSNEIIKSFNFNLFEANNSITLDGVKYRIRIISKNIDSFLNVNNPSTEEWKKWETEIWKLGQKLAGQSNNTNMKNLFALS
ncbi:hypothetical protein ACFFLS_24590 [Flavobacterium procerum]|uniref:DUF4304 domain-containing protein n=1 Tax=Flavobacterium procerum TaxID=1455569 RepID=A0ABV6C064_9FLAO